MVPDVIANAGGVTVSYFEWVQDFSSFFWTEAEINDRLEQIMVEALKAVVSASEKHKVSLRTAAFIIACTRARGARIAWVVSVTQATVVRPALPAPRKVRCEATQNRALRDAA